MRERRQHLRTTTPVLVEFVNPHTTKPERSFTQDVSEAGLRFPTSAKLHVGDQLSLALSVPFQNSTIRTNGRVTWVREIARLGGVQYEIGLQFAWIEDPDRQRLAHTLQTFTPPR